MIVRNTIKSKYNVLRLLWLRAVKWEAKRVKSQQGMFRLLRKTEGKIQPQARTNYSIRTIYRYRKSFENFLKSLFFEWFQSVDKVPTTDLATKVDCAAVVLHSPLSSGLRVLFPNSKRTWFFDTFKKYLLKLNFTN